MEAGVITREELAVFRPLLLGGVAAALEAGEPVLALGLSEGELACGAAAGWLSGGAFELASLYVAPDYRRRGGGRLLLGTLCRVLEERCASVEASYAVTRAEHQALAPFLEAVGFVREEELEAFYGIQVGELARTPFFAGAEQDGPAVPFAQVSEACLRQAYQQASVQEGACLSVPLTDPSVDAQVSMALLEKGAVRSFVAFDHSFAGMLTLAWAVSARAQDLPVLLKAAFARVVRSCPPEAGLAVQAVNPASAALVRKLLPQARPLSHTYVRRLQCAAPAGD